MEQSIKPKRQPKPLRVAFVADCLDGHLAGGVVSARRFVDYLQTDNDLFIIGTGAKDLECVVMPAIHLPSKRYSEMGFLLARPIRSRIAQALVSADVVHLQFPFWLSFVALEEAKRLGKPVVAAMHVQPENLLYNVGLRSPYLSSRIYDWMVEHFYNHADMVICPTRFAEKKLRDHGLVAPVQVISNGFSIDPDKSPGQRDAADIGSFLIASVGRYSWDKRQDVLIEAVRKSAHQDNIKLVIGGAGPREHTLRRLGAKLKHPPEMGYLSPNRLHQVLSTADLFVHCGEVELEGMSVLDAMSAGLPAIIADSSESAASSFALDQRFSFPAGDVDTLRDKIDYLIEHPRELDAARAPAKTLARQFEFASNADKLSDVYRQLASASVVSSIASA